MSDTAVAILILPFLAALVITLESLRIGCTRTWRLWQGQSNAGVEKGPLPSSVEA